ncbi:hypothetical protein H8356DRAFT_1088918 [Neocallimastix lanati (nom. inval.)]|nr:hypothetical protein H8356DRAFT_1088918 [Neocallimastix sp. JGI-2020a]
MNDLIEQKDILIGRQRIRNNKLEFALKEALFFLQRPFDVDLVQTQFLTTLLTNFKDNPELLNHNSISNTSSTTNSNSMTAQAKKYLKKINKKHESKTVNQGTSLKISKEENDLCMQFAITYLKQALEWIEKDVDIEDDHDKFKIKRYLSVDKIAKSESNQLDSPIRDNNSAELENSDNSINLSYSKIKINYQKGPSAEEITNEINLNDYFENPNFINRKPTLKRSSTFRRDDPEIDSKLSSFVKSRSVNSLFLDQYNQLGNLNFCNDSLINDTKAYENNVECKKENSIEMKSTSGSSNSSLENTNKSNTCVQNNIPIVISPSIEDSKYNHIYCEASEVDKNEFNKPNEDENSNTKDTIEDKETEFQIKRSLSLNAKDKHFMATKVYNDYLEKNNMINIIISLKNDNAKVPASDNNGNNDNHLSINQNLGVDNNAYEQFNIKPELLSNFKFISAINIKEVCKNFEKQFPDNRNEKSEDKYYFCINGQYGMEIFKRIIEALDQEHPDKNYNDKNNFVSSIEYTEQLEKIEKLEKENNRLKYELEKKTLEYDHEHMAKIMLDKELEDLTSQLFLQANKLVETECHKLEDTKIRLKELNDKYNYVKSQLQKRENELNGLKKIIIKNEDKKVQKRTKIFPKVQQNSGNQQYNKMNTLSSPTNTDEVVSNSGHNSIDTSSNTKIYVTDGNTYLAYSPEFNSSVLSSGSPSSGILKDIDSNDGIDGSAINIINKKKINSDIGSENIDYNELNMLEDEKIIIPNRKNSLESQFQDIKTWNLYSTKVIAIQNDKIYSYIDGGQFNEFQNYIRDSLIKVNNNKKKKSNIFCLPNTSFMKRCIEDEIYPCLFEHCSYDQPSSIQNKRNSITKTHVNFKKKLQKALICNGVIIIPYELLTKNGKLFKNQTNFKNKNNSDNNINDSIEDIIEDENIEESGDSYSSKKIEYYLEYDFVHPLPLPPRKKCCLCMNYKDCHYRIFFKNIDKDKDGISTSNNSESNKLINNVNIIFNNNTSNIPNTQGNMTSDNKNSYSHDKDYLTSPTNITSIVSPNLNGQTNKIDPSPLSSPTLKTVEDYTAKCYNITGEFLNQLRNENIASYNENFFLCPICRDKIVSVSDLYSYLNSLESKLTGTSKGQSSILNMFKNVILLKRRIATAKLGALQFFEKNNDLFKDESLSALYDNSSEEWENYVKII